MKEERITTVVLSNDCRLEVSEVMVHLGANREANTITFENFALDTIDRNGHDFIKISSDTKTKIAGLFVVGDLGHYTGKNYMLATCLTDAINAATQVARYLDENAQEQVMVSTHYEAFEERNQAILLHYFD
ncbi:MAG: hypothetical protein LBS41_05795 [Streptococcaceae bacterium]|nr:hypothetical protein [Streptococcaceae bacterium]